MTISFANLSASSERWSQSGDPEEFLELSIDIQVHTVQITISSFSASNRTLEGFFRVRDICVARVLRQFQRSLDVTCPFSMLRVQVVDQGNSNAANRASFKTRGGGFLHVALPFNCYQLLLYHFSQFQNLVFHSLINSGQIGFVEISIGDLPLNRDIEGWFELRHQDR